MNSAFLKTCINAQEINFLLQQKLQKNCSYFYICFHLDKKLHRIHPILLLILLMHSCLKN